ncbi:MAG: ArnT family glycosyltransferase [Phycisphaerales bacterium]
MPESRTWLPDLRLAALVGVLVVARLAYLAWSCPYSLVEDEAQYWVWSQNLALSYYTKGPGIAWTIAASTALLGDTEFGVRFAAPLFSGLMTLAAAGLVRTITGDPRRALYAAFALQLAPILQATALLGTIDGPYGAFWALAACFGWRAFNRGGFANWIALGASIGLGFLFKYTILLLVPGLAMFAIVAARARAGHQAPGDRRSPFGPVLALGALVICASPVLIWNDQHHWPTLAHLLGHVGFAEHGAGAPAPVHVEPGEPWSPLWLPQFLGTQLGLAGPGLLLASIGLVRAWRARRDPQQQGLVYLALCGVPILLFYLLLSLIAEPEGNWPLAAYVTLLPLGGIVAADGIAAWRERVAAWRCIPPPRPREGVLLARPESPVQILWHVTVGFGLVCGIVMARVDLLARVPAVGGFVPVGRLRQGAELAAGVQAARARLRESTGADPTIVAAHYGRASQLAFYLPGRPPVFCASSRLGGRPTPQDFWPAHDLDTALYFGQPKLLLVGGTIEQWSTIVIDVRDLGAVPGLERKGLRVFSAVGRRPLD